MNFRILLLLLFWGIFASGHKVVGYKSDYYSVLQSVDTLKMNQQIKILSNLRIPEKQAYIGTLLMKKAGLMSSIRDKINTFKEGKKLLEDAITNNDKNAEYHFLRLVIQENCPSILRYNNKITEDSQKIREGFKYFDTDVKTAIIDYCKVSKTLREEDLL